MKEKISIICKLRENENPQQFKDSLNKQTFKDFKCYYDKSCVNAFNKASGEYVLFTTNNNYLNVDCLSKLYFNANNSDIVYSNYYIIEKEKLLDSNIKYYNYKCVKDNPEVLINDINLSCMLIKKSLIKSEYINENDLLYMSLVPILLYKAKKVTFVDDFLCYCKKIANIDYKFNDIEEVVNNLFIIFNGDFYYELEYIIVSFLLDIYKKTYNKNYKKMIIMYLKSEFPYYHYNKYLKKGFFKFNINKSLFSLKLSRFE